MPFGGGFARQEYRVDGLPEPLSHYVDAVCWGNQLYVSGCVAIGPDGGVIAPGDVAARESCTNMSAPRCVRPAPVSRLKVVVYLTDVNDHRAVNEVRKEFFGDARPASTLVEISGLVLPGLLVEMEAVAGIPGS